MTGTDDLHFDPKRSRIAVIGAGTMGAGIADVFVRAGYTTHLCDASQTTVDRAVETWKTRLKKDAEKGKISASQAAEWKDRLLTCTPDTLPVAQLYIEAIVELPDVKQQLFGRLEELAGGNAILATNTSSLPVTALAHTLRHPDRLVGMHFFNPALLMPLVEVISGEATHPDVAQSIFNLVQQIGKCPVMVRDEPGFLVNRVARPYYTESLLLVEEQTASLEQVDRLLESRGFRMGPFRLMDLIGVDVNFSVTSSLHERFYGEPRFRPSRLQARKVAAGQHGRKTGVGFYRYDPPPSP
ncbi:MAG: 3-hydroxybutyryl-CoA dehydrogenase [Sphingomonadales bacterium]|nr:3-hydroxybutyryl-CoA dehydrogenase [Sphingomonadales bacterium]